jgi:GxxExxY protein
LANERIRAETYLHEQLTHQIINAAMEVHRHFGPGFLESLYEDALCYELTLRSLVVDRQIDLDVRYKDLVLVGKFRADLIVNKLVLVENKASRGLTPQDEAQLLNYLKVAGIRVGLLFNFGKPSLEIARRIV